MSTLPFISGFFLLTLGIISLPAPPVEPAVVKATGALTGFFFGGWFIICGIFIRKYGRHGKIALGMIAICGVCFALYEVVPTIMRGTPLQAPLIYGGLLVCSLILTGITLAALRQSRGVRVA